MKKPQTTEEKILAAIEGLAKRQSQLEIVMNEMIGAQTEITAELERLTSALLDDDDDEDAPLIDAEPVDPPSDLALDKWLAAQRKKAD